MRNILAQIFASATKLVFVIITLALIRFTQRWIIDWKDFFTIVAMVFTAYYSKNNTGAITEREIEK
jgi:hypothetical protein